MNSRVNVFCVKTSLGQFLHIMFLSFHFLFVIKSISSILHFNNYFFSSIDMSVSVELRYSAIVNSEYSIFFPIAFSDFLDSFFSNKY